MKDERDLERVFRRDLGRVALPREERWIPRAPGRPWVRTVMAVPLGAAVLLAAVGLGLALEERRQAGRPGEPGPAEAPLAGSAAPSPTGPSRTLAHLPIISRDLGYTIVAIPPWRRSELLSLRDPTPATPGTTTNVVGHDLWTRRTPEFERANAGHSGGDAWHWALLVIVEKNPEGLTLQQWIDAGKVGSSVPQRVDQATIDGRPALNVRNGTRGDVNYLVARGDEVISISYRLQGPPPDHSAADIKAELDAMIASITLAPGPVGSRTPSPSPAQRSPVAPSPSVLTRVAGFPGVEIGGLGAVRGDVVFAARIVGDGWGTHEVWVIPLAGGEPRVVLRYPRTWATDAWPQRYLSPDGRHYAFEVERGGVHRIAIADLTTGAVSLLRTDDSRLHDRLPAWDPSGTRLAFARTEGDIGSQRDAGLWMTAADGTALKRLVAGSGSRTYIHQWTPDGRAVAFYQGIGYDVVDVATGVRTSMSNVVSADASWRSASPRLIAHGDGDVQTIFTADGPDGARTVILRGASRSEFISYPRWRPGTDEFLYLRSADGTRELRARSLSGDERTLTSRGALSPTWTADGSSVVYIHAEEVALPSPSPCPTGSAVCPGAGGRGALVTTELRVVHADGTGDRSLFRLAPAGMVNVPGWCVCNDGLAVRRY